MNGINELKQLVEMSGLCDKYRITFEHESNERAMRMDIRALDNSEVIYTKHTFEPNGLTDMCRQIREMIDTPDRLNEYNTT